MWIVLYGSPVDGYKGYGPFNSRKEAEDWSEKIGEGGEFIMSITSPENVNLKFLYPWGDDSGVTVY